jgi:hypothetical protein
MRLDPGQIVTALVEAELTAEKWEEQRYVPRGNVVTFTAEIGTGYEIAARAVAERLGVGYYDDQILEAVVAAVPEDRAAMERLDRQVSPMREEVVRQIVAGKSVLDEYRRHLMDVILGIAGHEGVIVGREAHLMLSGHKVFRVRVVGSVACCAGRVAQAYRLSEEEARSQVLRAREDHAAFVRQVFGRDINDPVAFDLVVNSDHVPAEVIADVVIDTMHRAGFAVPKDATAGLSGGAAEG